MVVGGFAFMGGGFALLAGSHFIPIYYLSLLALVAGATAGSQLPMAAAVNNWFRQRRATAMGVMLLPSVAAVIFVPSLGAAAGLLGTVNTPAAWLVVAAVVLALIWPLVKVGAKSTGGPRPAPRWDRSREQHGGCVGSIGRRRRVSRLHVARGNANAGFLADDPGHRRQLVGVGCNSLRWPAAAARTRVFIVGKRHSVFGCGAEFIGIDRNGGDDWRSSPHPVGDVRLRCITGCGDRFAAIRWDSADSVPVRCAHGHWFRGLNHVGAGGARCLFREEQLWDYHRNIHRASSFNATRCAGGIWLDHRFPTIVVHVFSGNDGRRLRRVPLLLAAGQSASVAVSVPRH